VNNKTKVSRDGLNDALRRLRSARRHADDGDRPPPSAFAGKKVRLISGQIDLYGVQYGAQPDADDAEDASDAA
jgi:hypothetical protein